MRRIRRSLSRLRSGMPRTGALVLALAAHAHAQSSDEDLMQRYLVALPAAVEGLAAVDDREHLSTPEALAQTFDALLARVPEKEMSAVEGGAFDAVGQIEGVVIRRAAFGHELVEFRGGGAVIHDWQCSFLFATVAHSVFDLDTGERQYEQEVLRILVAGKEHSGDQIESMFPEHMRPLNAIRDYVDFLLLVVQKPRPCEPYPVLAPVTAVTDADLAQRGHVALMCHDPESAYPAPWLHRCAALLEAHAFPPKDLGVSVLAYDSCVAPMGTSGCPLVVQLGDRDFFLGVEARAATSVSKGREPVKDINSASRAAVLSGAAWRWAHELMQQPYESR